MASREWKITKDDVPLNSPRPAVDALPSLPADATGGGAAVEEEMDEIYDDDDFEETQ